MAEKRDYYEVLGVSREADDAAIKSAYRKLAKKHLQDGTLILYDISSSYYEGHCCKLAKYGHNRDKKQGKMIIVYGLLTDAEGRPVAIEAFEGNTADPTTVPAQAEKIREQFGLEKVVLVGDRGMITTTQVAKLKEYSGMGWISAIKGQTIRKLIDKGHMDRSLFDDRNIAEIQSPEFPGERLIACYNPLLDDRRKRKREELLAATEEKLEHLRAQVARRKKPMPAQEIGLRTGKIVNHFLVANQATIESNGVTRHCHCSPLVVSLDLITSPPFAYISPI